MMSDPIVAYLQQHLDQYVADLRHLSSIDSGSDDKAGVDAVQDWLGERLQRLGYSVERHPQERWGDDLVARGQGEGSGRILLLGHADTVYPRGTAALRPVITVGDSCGWASSAHRAPLPFAVVGPMNVISIKRVM